MNPAPPTPGETERLIGSKARRAFWGTGILDGVAPWIATALILGYGVYRMARAAVEG